MIVKENTHILFIEPTGKAEEPIMDELTAKVQAAFKAAETSKYAYKGFHICKCGRYSTNIDYILPNGQITNSLAVHYISEHRSEVPEYELKKVRKL